ncbi:MAG: hypothetical protein B7X97_06865 [Methylotenera sp. 17-45-7]|nr:MAG: hypothetical protein B7X97_06865 [Methylotenera sp. 17-45-7]
MNSQSLIIDNIAFAKRGERLNGQIAIASCQRLLDFLQSKAPDLSNASSYILATRDIGFSLVGELDSLGRYFLHLDLDAQLNTYCQRCLDSMVLGLKLDFHYLISDKVAGLAEDAFVDDSDDFDLQEPNQSMNLISLIEDELIMAMPIAPAHEFDCSKLAMQAGDKPNPFAVLKGLIKS